jgi:hypothetical protein
MHVPTRTLISTGFVGVLLYGCSSSNGPANQPLFLIATIDTGVGSSIQTSIAQDGAGRVHLAYSEEGAGMLRYATCAASCFDDASWNRTTVDTAAHSGLDNSIVADGVGGLHIAYQVYDGQGDLRYAACTTGCTQAGSWQVVTIDSAGNTGHDASLTVDGSQHLHVSYLEYVPVTGGLWRLKYATCASSCTTPGSWQLAVLDSARVLAASSRALVAAGSGRLQLAYQKADTTDPVPLYYASCDANCGTAANWSSVPLDGNPVSSARPVLVLDPIGAPRLDYWGHYNGQAALVFGGCDSGCGSITQWGFLPLQIVSTSSSDIAQHSLLIDAAGRPHASFRDAGLAYASCVANCTLPGSWFEVVADGSALSGGASSVVLLAGGQIGIAYLAPGGSGGRLRFAVSN